MVPAGCGWQRLGMWMAKVGYAHGIAVGNSLLFFRPGSPLGNTTITRLGLSHLGDSRMSPSKPWGHSDRAMPGSRFGRLPWFSLVLVQLGCISHGRKTCTSAPSPSAHPPVSSQCLESPCPSPRRAAKHPFCSPNPLGMLLSQVSSKALRASGALEVLEETCSSRTAVSCCLSAPKDDAGGGHLN